MRKQNFLLIALVGVLLLLMLSIFISCEQEETYAKATVETSQVTSITEATATLVGIITSDGGSEVTSQGFCWSTSPTPTIENDTTIATTGTLAFTSSIKGLTPGTTYYVRAFAMNKGGVAYGLNMIFITKTFSIATTPISVFLLTATSAIGGGNIISDGDSSCLTVVARGVCWNTFPSPTIENSKTIDGIGGGRFKSKMDSLTAFTTYYVRAYATNGNGTIYGNEVSFTTQNGIVGITTNNASSITISTATCGGSITSDGGATITERGLCWNTSPSPTTANSKTVNLTSADSYSININGLTPVTKYYVRTYAINSIGISYGNEVSFTTQSGLIGLTTSDATSITPNAAICGGNITSDGGATVTERGLCWNTSSSPTIANNKASNGNGIGAFSSNISGLIPGTTYFFRSYGVNSIGTSYGNEVSFTTQSGLIGLTTSDATSITLYTAICGGTISSDGGATVTERGLCWSTSTNPTIANNKKIVGSGLGGFTTSLTGLSANTHYYVRSYATNSVGTSYGNNISFTTLPLSGTVTDIEGNVYNFITINNLTWMIENLKTTKYRNGESIVTTSPATKDITSESTPKYQWSYNGDEGNVSKYGRLYTWYTVTDIRNIAPSGWHVATDAEWTSLENFLIANGFNYDGTTIYNRLSKSIAAKTDWTVTTDPSSLGSPGSDLSKNNSSGFSSLPGGDRNPDGTYENIKWCATWWCSVDITPGSNWVRLMGFNTSSVLRYALNKNFGASVRCVRDY